jgi:CheY-like chemotaxis protein
LEFTPAGLVYTLEGPLGAPEEDVSQADVTTWTTFQTPSSDSRTRPQKGQRVLVVEDEPFIAMELQALLESEGHTVVGPALNLERARKLVDGEQFDLVLLDINMGDEKSTPIAIELLDLGISFAFVTGYADAGFMPSRLQAVPRINKPYGLDEIREIIDILTRGAVTDPGSLPSADSPSGLDGTRAGST